MASQAKREFERLCGGNGVVVYDFSHDGEEYIMTDGTGEGRFIYEADEVERWADEFEQHGAPEGSTAYDSFCDAMDACVGLEVARAAYEATGIVACEPGSCRRLLLTEDERQNPAPGFWGTEWGTEGETYYVTDSGIWCVQSPDLRPGENYRRDSFESAKLTTGEFNEP